MHKSTLSLFQLCDSTLPTGAFSHSYGLETYIQEDKVHDKQTFMEWLRVYLNEQLVYSDGFAAKLVYEALEENDLEKIWELDQMLFAQNAARETRDGTQRVGERMLSLVETLYEIPLLATYKSRIRDRVSYGHPAIVFTIVGHHLKVRSDSTILFYLYSVVSSLVQNAVRAIPLGQTDGQKAIKEFQDILIEATEKINSLDESDFGVVCPALELSQMQHERVNVRIFMS
ncbi:urease accessory protein UreF [Neobacillus notoginsengisoli]|uniref:Urease accessory protein UreF n=1 Tax=Neobacillus notoginsengisoli TaxID=1578198 RepID=A0A417YSY6_9BACI|nr:urease accessory protein UreF [Neobacillus notoginsengisoli]RHW39089.1 urease accessory protein UreF [Neobacillus notoginsengisoli]